MPPLNQSCQNVVDGFNCVKFTNAKLHGDNDVKKLTIAFIFFVIMLFAGIFIMMQPDKVGITAIGQQDESTLKSIVRVGAYLTVIGLVGLAVLGFVISSPKNGDGNEKQDENNEKEIQDQNQTKLKK
jgi:Na+-driven multidrug efflux pump